MDKLIALSLPVAQVQTILAALAECPYRLVAPIVMSIQAQAEPQVAPPEAPKEETEASNTAGSALTGQTGEAKADLGTGNNAQVQSWLSADADGSLKPAKPE